MQADGPLTGAPLNFPSAGGGAGTSRAIEPVYDDLDGVLGPGLTYKVQAGDDLASIVIIGENLTGITTVDVSTDVQEGGNPPGPPPVVGILFVTDTSIVVNLDATLAVGDSYWGIILRDGDGIAYGAPSPIKVFAPGP